MGEGKYRNGKAKQRWEDYPENHPGTGVTIWGDPLSPATHTQSAGETCDAHQRTFLAHDTQRFTESQELK